VAREASFDRLPENGASLLLTTLNREVVGRSTSYSDLHSPNTFLFGDVAPAVLDRVEIQRLDAAEANLVNVQFRNCQVLNLHVDETTLFGASAPAIHRLHVKAPKGGVRSIYDPTEISAWIESHSAGATPKSTDNEAAIALLDKVCRVMLRQHMIKDHETDDSGKLLRNPYWPEVERILSEVDMIDRIYGKQMAGAQAPFVRVKDPFSILAHRGSGVIRTIWKKVAAIPN
jgi:hypothetical protein